jgi:C4-dicarboxylate-specific signal transduction histidine kinase
LFEEINPIDKYKWFGGVGLLFIVLQSILIAALIKLNKRQKLMTQKIIDTESRYNRFLHEDRSLRLGQLTASLSHELNQPFTAILSNAQAGINFINSNQATPELLKEIFQKIVDNDKRGASVLSSIRGMLKLEIREKEKTDLNYLIEEVVTVFEGEASKLSTKLFVQLKDTPIYVLADKIQIQQVILNLIFNASQSMERSDTKNKTIDITQSVSDEDIVVSIRDYGNGIDESILAKVFNPFVTSKSEGMGMGLAICRSIIEDHGGKIWAENLPEGGAKFSFSLKMIKDE